MSGIKGLLLGKGTSVKKDFFWNMMGSGVFSLASMLLTYLTIRMIGEDGGGIFSIAITLSQMFAYIVYYETRNYQITDVKDEFHFSDYYMLKIVNSVLMMVVCIGYVAIKQYDLSKVAVVLLVCVYRLIDGFADVFESQFQKKGRLDIAGKSLTFRTILSVLAYFIALGITKDLILSVIIAIVFAIIGMFIFDILIFKGFGSLKFHFQFSRLVQVWKACFPLFIGTFLWTYLLSASRIAVDDCMASKYQAYYQVLFMPVSVINLFAGFIFRPMLMELARLNDQGKGKEFWLKIGKMIGFIMIFTLACMVGAYLVGVQILGVMVNCNLDAYRGVLTLLIFAGGFNAVAVALYYVLTIFRGRISIIVGYVVASITAYIISPIMVRAKGLSGGAWSYFIAVLVLSIIFVICILIMQNKKKKTVGENAA